MFSFAGLAASVESRRIGFVSGAAFRISSYKPSPLKWLEPCRMSRTEQ